MDRPTHLPARDGDCTACHQPHASSVGPLLKAPLRTLCASCHGPLDERLTAQVAHAPAVDDDGCLTCHGPHLTRHAALLQEPVVDGCLNCHDGQAPEFQRQHLSLPIDALDCVGCHDPHASDMTGMLHPQSHPPFAEGDCSICHEATDGGAP